jgi:hypothetical protein
MKGGCGCTGSNPPAVGGLLTSGGSGSGRWKKEKGKGKRRRTRTRSRGRNTRNMKKSTKRRRTFSGKRKTRLMRGGVGLSFSLLGDQATNVANYTSTLMGSSTGLTTLPGVTTGLSSGRYLV